MKHTYVGSTIYHIYLSILHIIRSSQYNINNTGENILFLIESTPNIEKLIPNLKKRFFRDVYIISERKEHVNDLGKFNYTFKRKEKLVPYLEKKHPELVKEKEFLNISSLYLCDVDSSKSYFLYKYGYKEISMIEDGANTYRQRRTKFELFAKMYITKTLIGGGFDKETKKIYAQFPEKLPKPLLKKAIELNIKKEVAKLNQDIKDELFNLFLPKTSFTLNKNNNALILTQPISEDQVIKNEETKIEIYKDVISKVPSNLNIVLKVHPREITQYDKYFSDITILPALFPIEILGLKEGFHFKQGYTLFSTALSNLEIVKERFFLGKDYLDKFTARGTKELIKQMTDNS